MEKDMSKASNYINNVKSELAKVIFPVKAQIKTAYISVFIVVTVIALYLAMIDGAMSFTLSSVIK
jgi:preprotein translocase subunit SecE